MSRVSVFFLLVIAPFLAMLLAWLGVKTIPTNPSGWFPFLFGMSYISGLGITISRRRARFWESTTGGATRQEEKGDRSFWLIALGMMAVFFLPPIEYLHFHFPALLPLLTWLPTLGVDLAIGGIALAVWARRTLGAHYAGHLSVKSEQVLVRDGPYHFIRHPAYAGFLLLALGISLGYVSLAGLCSFFALLLPGITYRIKVEDQLLYRHFGEAYRQYARSTSRLLPGIW